MMLFAILFGLSMDYEVFLLSRIQEEYDRTGDNATAVADGLATTARVITAAAADHVLRLRLVRARRRPGRSRCSASAWPSPCSSTPPSSAWCSCPPRWSCSATPTGGSRSGSTGILPNLDVEGEPDEPVIDVEPRSSSAPARRTDPPAPLAPFCVWIRQSDRRIETQNGATAGIRGRRSWQALAMAEADDIELVRSIYEAMAEADFGRLFGYLDESVVITQDPALPWGGEWKGHDGFADFGWYALHVEHRVEGRDEAVFAADGDVIQFGRDAWHRPRQRQRVRHRRGPRVDLPADGRAVRGHFSIDTAAMLDVLG